MAKKKDDSIKDALTLGRKKELKKNTEKSVSKIEEATKEIHEETPKEEEVYKAEVKKTSLHIPIELYTTLKMEAFKRNITLRKLIISALNEKFK